VDAKTNLDPLDKSRLSSWHKALFPTNQSGLQTITAGSYRRHEEEMKIVSGSWEKEKVHYVAPPSSEMDERMKVFFEWLNQKEDTGVIKAIVAHLYFVLIHPFEDGNGRMARAITDYMLAKESLVNAHFYSMATAIYSNRKEYYEMLDKTCKNSSMDVTLWVEWFIKILHESVDSTLKKVEVVKIKIQFWDKHLQSKLNERQKKVVLKMLSYLPNEFQGGMKVSKYMNITKSIRLTASRDLADLTQKGIMEVIGFGRATSYVLRL
jgi:Fic family protein